MYFVKWRTLIFQTTRCLLLNTTPVKYYNRDSCVFLAHAKTSYSQEAFPMKLHLPDLSISEPHDHISSSAKLPPTLFYSGWNLSLRSILLRAIYQTGSNTVAKASTFAEFLRREPSLLGEAEGSAESSERSGERKEKTTRGENSSATI